MVERAKKRIQGHSRDTKLQYPSECGRKRFSGRPRPTPIRQGRIWFPCWRPGIMLCTVWSIPCTAGTLLHPTLTHTPRAGSEVISKTFSLAHTFPPFGTMGRLCILFLAFPLQKLIAMASAGNAGCWPRLHLLRPAPVKRYSGNVAGDEIVFFFLFTPLLLAHHNKAKKRQKGLPGRVENSYLAPIKLIT